MPPMSIMVLGSEKELLKIEEVFDSVQRAVGGLRMFRATKSVDGVGQLQKAVATTGACHAAFLMDRFTAKGKEDFSDTLRKLLREKFPKVPVVLWGDAGKGGKQGKDYHVTLAAPGGAANSTELTAMLKKIKSGEVVADYGDGDKKKGGKSKDGATTPDRKSLDNPRTSIDSPRVAKESSATDGAAAPAAAPAARRVSLEGGAPPQLRRKSLEALASEPAADMQFRRGSFDMTRQGSSFARSSGGMSPMRSSGSMTSMGGMSPLAGFGGVGGGHMPSMTGMSPLAAGGMAPMVGGMGGMMGMAPMNGMIGMSPMGGMVPMVGGGMMPSMAALATAGGSGSFGGDGGMGGMSAGMAGMSLAPPSGLMSPGGGVNSPGGYDGGAAAPVPDAANVELIKMLGAEVMRLQKLVEEKRMREAYNPTTMV